MKVLESKDIMAIEALENLQSLKSRTVEQEKGMEFLKTALPIQDKGTVEEIKKELSDIKEFKEHQLNKLTEISPLTEEQVNAILAKERLRLEKDDAKKITEIFRSVTNGKK